MKLRSLCMLFTLPLAAVGATAQELTKVLLPVAIASDLPGAFGSRWATRMQVRNNGSQDIRVASSPSGLCGITVCPIPVVPPQQTVDLSSTVQIEYPYPGAFLYVTPGANTSFNLRVQDLSRQHRTWGTEIAIVRQADVFTGTLTLINITTKALVLAARR